MSRAMKDSGVPWIGSIPENWETASLRTLFHQRKSQNSDGREKNLLSLSYGNIIQKDINSSFGLLPENFNSYNVVESGDIVLRLTDLQNDQRSLRTGLVRMRGIITSAYVTISPSIRVCERYFHLLLHAADICKLFYNLGNGVRQNLQFKDLRMLPLIQPSLEEQQRIADFLDAKAQEVDAAIEKTRESIEEYKKLKQVIITHAVTKGIRPNRAMKDSGMEWIGEIPDEWMGRRLRYLCLIQTGNLDTQDSNPAGQYPFYVRSPIVERCDAYTFEGDAILMAGDGAGAGRVFHLVSGKYGCHQRVYCLNHISSIVKELLHYYIKSLFINVIVVANSKSTVDSVRLLMLKDFPVFYGDNTEQQEIVTYLDEKCAAIDTLIEKKRQIITELESYKKSLIYEYVTGKKEVPA